jgi:cell division transport system permease protein
VKLIPGHRHAVRRALAMAGERPLAFVLSVLLAAVALALPLTLASLAWALAPTLGVVQPAPEISVFVAPKASARDVEALRDRCGRQPQVVTVTWLPKDDALTQLAKRSGLSVSAAELGSNPLPDVLVVRLAPGVPPVAIESLAADIRRWPLVDAVRAETDWYRKAIALGRALASLALVFGAMVVVLIALVLVGTVRLHASARRDEIALLQLVGAMPRFIVRPYAYGAAMAMALAAVIAVLAVWAGHAALRPPLAALTELYGTRLVLPDPEPTNALAVIFGATVFGAAVGAAGARLALRGD